MMMMMVVFAESLCKPTVLNYLPIHLTPFNCSTCSIILDGVIVEPK